MTDTQADASPLEARRAELRALHDSILEATKALPMPQSHAEAAHAFRCIASADWSLIQIYSKASLKTLRAYSPRTPGAHASVTPEPDDFVYIYDDDVEDEINQPSPPLRAEGEAGEGDHKRSAVVVGAWGGTEGADITRNKAPSVSLDASHLAATSPASLTLAREEKKEKAFAHLEGLLEKAVRLTGDVDDAQPSPFPPFKPVASQPARSSGPSIRALLPRLSALMIRQRCRPAPPPPASPAAS